MKKKLLWVSHFLLYPETGFGALQRSRNLLIEASKEFDLTLVCLVSAKESENFNAEFLTAAKESLLSYCKVVLFIQRETRPKGLRLLKFLIEPYSTLIFSTPELKSQLKKLILENNYNLVFSDTLGLTENILNLIKCPIVLNHHNVESAMMLRRALKEASLLKKLIFYWEGLRFKKYESNYCKKYELNILVSKQDALILKNSVGEIKAEVIPNPVNTEYYYFRKKPVNSKIISFIGGLNWYPNLSAMKYFLEKIWPEILLRQEAAIFKIVGKYDGEIEDDYKNVIFLNFVKDIREVLAATRVFICPIIDGGGTRLKIIDAIASGVPVVTTTIGVEGLDFEHEKHLLIADKPKDFARQVERLLLDDSLSLELAENAKKLLDEKYSLEVVGENLRNILNRLN